MPPNPIPAELLAEAAKLLSHSSPFGRQRHQVEKLVRNNRAVLVQLEALIQKHLDRSFEFPNDRQNAAAAKDEFRRFQRHAAKMISACDGVLEAWRTSPRSLTHYLALTLSEPPPHIDFHDLELSLEVLRALRDHCERTGTELQQKTRPGRGRPVNGIRRVLESETARILAEGGVTITKARDGVLARVLGFVYEAANEPAPEELIRVLVRVVDYQRRKDFRLPQLKQPPKRNLRNRTSQRASP